MPPEDKTWTWKFEPGVSLKNWRIVNDAVMGGRSESKFYLDEEGHGVFEGRISLENKGGFASLRYQKSPISLQGKNSLSLRIKGDGHSYQFRVKATAQDRASYVNYFPTSGNWETIHISLDALYPRFRGRNLEGPAFDQAQIVELGFLIAPERAESFKLKIKDIGLY